MTAWPLPDDVAAWRPDAYPLEERVNGVPATRLASSEMDTRPGNTDGIDIWAVAAPAGGYRIVVLDDYETTYASPIEHTALPLTTAELQLVVDGAHPVGDPEYAGIGQAWRERNTMEPADAAEVAAASTLRSSVYPGIGPADEARKAAWVARQG